jgi:hypothetical protein
MPPCCGNCSIKSPAAKVVRADDYSISDGLRADRGHTVKASPGSLRKSGIEWLDIRSTGEALISNPHSLAL